MVSCLYLLVYINNESHWKTSRGYAVLPVVINKSRSLSVKSPSLFYWAHGWMSFTVLQVSANVLSVVHGVVLPHRQLDYHPHQECFRPALSSCSSVDFTTADVGVWRMRLPIWSPEKIIFSVFIIPENRLYDPSEMIRKYRFRTIANFRRMATTPLKQCVSWIR